MRKAVIASDSFKGSLSSSQVADAASTGIRETYPDCLIDTISVADGGEGMVEALKKEMHLETRQLKVHDPLGRLTDASYGIGKSSEGLTAVIEMAEASGLTKLSAVERNPLLTSTYGTGELILDALEQGCRKFIIGIGGSATNDGGTGMLEALGFRFLNAAGKEIHGCCGEKLADIRSVDLSHKDRRLDECIFIAACDVETPFCGPDGAVNVFAEQKGADETMREDLESGMVTLNKVIREVFDIDLSTVKGSGAAGGLSGAMHAFLNAELQSGAELILDTVRFDERIQDADLIITGEGHIDGQTLKGKIVSAIIRRGEKAGKSILVIGGLVDNGICKEIMNERMTVLAIQDPPADLEELANAMKVETAHHNIRKTLSKYMQSKKNDDNFK